MKRQLLMGTIIVGITFIMEMNAFANQWVLDTNGWWYDTGNGTYPSKCWQWIDGNGDGKAECYYFNESGYCLLNTVTPDGYLVDETGAWTVDGIQQIKAVSVKSIDESKAIDSINFTDAQLQKIRYLIEPLAEVIGTVENGIIDNAITNWDREDIRILLYRYLDVWDIKEIDIGIIPQEDKNALQTTAYYDKDKVDLLMKSAFGRVWELPASWEYVPVYQIGDKIVWIGIDLDTYNLEINNVYQNGENLYLEGMAFNIYTDGTKVNKGCFLIKLVENPLSIFGYTIVSISKV